MFSRSWNSSIMRSVYFHAFFTYDLTADRNSLLFLNRSLQLSVSITLSISFLNVLKFTRQVLDKQIGVGICVLKKFICSSGIVSSLIFVSIFLIYAFAFLIIQFFTFRTAKVVITSHHKFERGKWCSIKALLQSFLSYNIHTFF